MCKTCDNGEYPHYGPAPHECYWRKPGGFDKNPLGTSTIEPFEKWPDNFLLEVEDPEDFNEVVWGYCGVYNCPECGYGLSPSEVLWTKEKVIEELSKLEAGYDKVNR